MKLNKDALIVWWYLWETVRNCPHEARNNPAFFSLLCDMMNHYPNEFDALDGALYAFAKLRG